MKDVPGFPPPQPIEYFSFSNVQLTVTYNPPTSISGIPTSAFVYSLRTQTQDSDNGTLVYSVTNPTIVNSATGVFTFNFTDSGTEPGVYDYDVWITNTPKPVAWGKVIIKKQQWQTLQNND